MIIHNVVIARKHAPAVLIALISLSQTFNGYRSGVINNVEGVSESIVVERDGKLVALVQPAENYIEWDKEYEDKFYEKLDSWKAKVMKMVNKNVSKASQVSSVEVMKEPFEKTATQKIRRFKYKDSAPTVEEEKKEK